MFWVSGLLGEIVAYERCSHMEVRLYNSAKRILTKQCFSRDIFFKAIFRVSVELTDKFGAGLHYHTTGLTIRMQFGTHKKRIVNPTKNTKMMKDG